MGNTADAHTEGKKVKREDEPCVFHLGGKIGWVDRGGSEPYKWSNLPVVKRFREDHDDRRGCRTRQVAVGIDDEQVHFSRAGQGRQRIPESSWQLISRAEGRPQQWRQTRWIPPSDEFLEWMVWRYALRDRRTRYAMEFHAIVCSGWLHRLPRAGRDWDI